MRIRTTSNDVSIDYPYSLVTTTTPPGTSVTTSGVAPGLTERAEGKYMEDVVTPHFHKLLAQGLIIINPMSSLDSRRDGTLADFGGVVFHTTENATGIHVVGTPSGLASLHAFSGVSQNLLSDLAAAHDGTLATALSSYNYGEVAGIEGDLVARCIANASSEEGTLSMVTAAELSKTADMLLGMGKQLNNLLKTLKKFQANEEVFRGFARLTFAEIKLLAKYVQTNGKGLKRFKSLRLTPKGMRQLASLCGLWLGYRYGIMATYYDVMSWSESINHHKKRARFTSSQATSYNSVDNDTATSNRHVDIISYSSLTRTTLSTAGCLVVPEIEGLHDTHGAGRVLSTAWELIPLSFVLDWFYDVSTRIAALETSFLRPVVGSWVVNRSTLTRVNTVTHAGKTTVEGVYPNHITFTGVGSRSATSVLTTKMVERKANPTVSYLPNIKVKLNWKRLADGVALAVVLRTTFKNLVARL